MALITLLSVARPEDRAAPRHEHDCDRCKFVGAIDFDAGQGRNDVYVCHEGDGETLNVRYGDEEDDHRSFPVSTARAIAAGWSPVDTTWRDAVKLYDDWAAAGRPEMDIMHLSGEFFDHFTLACQGTLSMEEDGDSGESFAVIGLSALVDPRHVAHFVSIRYPATHCQHSHDCCGQIYGSPARWEFIPNTGQRAILVRQRWHRNV